MLWFCFVDDDIKPKVRVVVKVNELVVAFGIWGLLPVRFCIFMALFCKKSCFWPFRDGRFLRFCFAICGKCGTFAVNVPAGELGVAAKCLMVSFLSLFDDWLRITEV